MGRSLFLLPAAGNISLRAQIQRLRDGFGHDSLKVEGPFADKDGAVAELVEHVRARARGGGISESDALMCTLLPQDILPEGYPKEEASMLEVPFVLKHQHMGAKREYPESAGEIASVDALAFGQDAARPVTPTGLTVLGVSVLRRLGVECYYSTYTCYVDEESSGKVEFVMPIIAAPKVNGLRMISMCPIPASTLSSSPPHLEVLDDDALLSAIKLENAYLHAKALMLDIAGGRPGSGLERVLRAMQIGHTLHEGKTIWAVRDAQEDVGSAKEILGPGTDLDSLRVRYEKDVVLTLTEPPRHILKAASVMLPEDIAQGVASFVEAEDKMAGLLDFLDTVSWHNAIPAFNSYLKSTSTMNEHMHTGSECERMGTGN